MSHSKLRNISIMSKVLRVQILVILVFLDPRLILSASALAKPSLVMAAPVQETTEITQPQAAKTTPVNTSTISLTATPQATSINQNQLTDEFSASLTTGLQKPGDSISNAKRNLLFTHTKLQSKMSGKDQVEEAGRETLSTLAVKVKQDTPPSPNPPPDKPLLLPLNATPYQVEIYGNEDVSNDPMSQVTNVTQLRDVSLGDWDYKALQSLVQRYGCIVGYPKGAFQSNRAISRFEFAAGLNACLNQVERLIAASKKGFVTKEDLATLQRLVQEFQAELTDIRMRIDKLEVHTTFIKDYQFSTTTKLFGQAIFALSGISGDVADDSGSNINANIAFSDRIRLFFITSFTGKDMLLTRLQASNTPSYAGIADTPQTSLSFPQNSNNGVFIERLEYSFPIGDKLNAYIGASAAAFEYFVPIFNDILNNSTTGTISVFGFYNPIYLQSGGTGGGFTYNFSNTIGFSAGYLAGDANNPRVGFTRGVFGALAQLRVSPSKKLDFGLTYVRSYNSLNIGVVGSKNANNPFGGSDVSANSYGLEANFRLSPSFSLGGWVGYTQANAESGSNKGANADILNFAVTLVFPDLFDNGNLGAIIIGEQPRVINNDLKAFKDPDSSLHLEALYRFQVTDNISITPGLIVITNPNGNSNNDTIYQGILRTSFQF